MSTFQIQISSRAKKDLRKIAPSAQKRIISAIKLLQENQKPRQFKPLGSHEVAQFRLRVGDYRILYDIYSAKKTILILKIGYRKDIYR